SLRAFCAAEIWSAPARRMPSVVVGLAPGAAALGPAAPGMRGLAAACGRAAGADGPAIPGSGAAAAGRLSAEPGSCGTARLGIAAPGAAAPGSVGAVGSVSVGICEGPLGP